MKYTVALSAYACLMVWSLLTKEKINTFDQKTGINGKNQIKGHQHEGPGRLG